MRVFNLRAKARGERETSVSFGVKRARCKLGAMTAASPLAPPAPAPLAGASSPKWTYDQLRALPGEARHELHDGRLVTLPSPNSRHQKIYRALLKILERWIDAGGNGLLYLQPMDLKIDPYRTLVPDLSYYVTEDASAVESDNGNYLNVAPDLVVEIVSPSSQSTDRVYKFRVYAEIGARFYWIIDPEGRVFQAYRLREGAPNVYEFEANLTDGDAFAPELFPGLNLDMTPLFGPPAISADQQGEDAPAS